jgi:hypothetical protein
VFAAVGHHGGMVGCGRVGAVAVEQCFHGSFSG